VGAPVFQSTPIITLEALTIAYALAPGLSPSFSADFLVMIDTTSMPGQLDHDFGIDRSCHSRGANAG
jgi:hypothetical protein